MSVNRRIYGKIFLLHEDVYGNIFHKIYYNIWDEVQDKLLGQTHVTVRNQLYYQVLYNVQEKYKMYEHLNKRYT